MPRVLHGSWPFAAAFTLAAFAAFAAFATAATAARAQSTRPEVAPKPAASGSRQTPPARAPDAATSTEAEPTEAAPTQAKPTAEPDTVANDVTNAPRPQSAPPGAAASVGPAVELPEEMKEEPKAKPAISIGGGEITNEDLLRGLMNYRFRSGQTVVGGYGQLQMLATQPHGQSFSTRANVRRVVMFLAHNFSDKFRTYAEFEWENAIACSSCKGSAEIEQAFLDWKLFDDVLALRAGLVLVPMGIVNQWHEPPVFNGVDRPDVDQRLIPTTWRELGIGVFGNPIEPLRYELYFTTTINPLNMGPDGFSRARSGGSLTLAHRPALTGRVEYEPFLGVIFGASFFASDLGGNEELDNQSVDTYNASGKKTSLFLPFVGWSVDGRVRRKGWEARAVFTQFFMPNADKLMSARREGGDALYFDAASGNVLPTRMDGGYVECGYDILRLLADTDHQLVPFVRLEYYRTQAGVPDGYQRQRQFNAQVLTAGFSYRPIPQIVFKGDFQLRDRERSTNELRDELQLNLGFGYMF